MTGQLGRDDLGRPLDLLAGAGCAGAGFAGTEFAGAGFAGAGGWREQEADGQIGAVLARGQRRPGDGGQAGLGQGRGHVGPDVGVGVRFGRGLARGQRGQPGPVHRHRHRPGHVDHHSGLPVHGRAPHLPGRGRHRPGVRPPAQQCGQAGESQQRGPPVPPDQRGERHLPGHPVVAGVIAGPVVTAIVSVGVAAGLVPVVPGVCPGRAGGALHQRNQQPGPGQRGQHRGLGFLARRVASQHRRQVRVRGSVVAGGPPAPGVQPSHGSDPTPPAHRPAPPR